jgi:probable F420-dependent oxidoreductase
MTQTVTTQHPFRFAVQTRAWADPDETVVVARHVESLGYDELYSFDHVGTVDPFLPLLTAVAATERIKVGPLVLNNELHHPALLARAAATLDRHAGGRLVLGLGTGYAADEHRAIGVELRPPGLRVSRFAECVQILRDLLDTGASHRTGDHHVVAIDDLGIRPVQTRVPFLIGGFGRRVLGIAARHAEIVQFTGLSDRPDGTMEVTGFGLDAVAQRAAWLSEVAGERDRELERSALVQFVHVGADGPSVDELAARFGIDPATIPDSPFVWSGTEQAIIDKLERVRALTGINHYVVRDIDPVAPLVAALAGL